MKTMLNVCACLAGIFLLLSPDAAFACEKCFGAAADDPTVQAIAMSMASLLVMVGFVWSGIGMFFANMRKRMKMLEPGDLAVNEYGDLSPNAPDESGS